MFKDLTFGKIAKGLMAALVVAIVLRILIPLPVRFFLSLTIFVFVVEMMFKEVGTDTKTVINKVAVFGFGVLAFVGFRIIVGHAFNFPLVETYQSLEGSGLLGSLFQETTPQNIILELLFLLPGIGFAHGLIKGSRGTKKTLYVFSVLMFGVVLWQVKQVQNSEAISRYSQSSVNEWTTELNYSAMEKEARAKIIVLEARQDIRNFALSKDTRVNPKEVIRKGRKMMLLSDKPMVDPDIMAEPMVKVTLEKNGVFKGAKVFVPYRKVQRVNIFQEEKETAEKKRELTPQEKLQKSVAHYTQKWSEPQKVVLDDDEWRKVCKVNKDDKISYLSLHKFNTNAGGVWEKAVIDCYGYTFYAEDKEGGNVYFKRKDNSTIVYCWKKIN